MVGQFDLLAEGKRHTCRQDADPYTNARKVSQDKIVLCFGGLHWQAERGEGTSYFYFPKKNLMHAYLFFYCACHPLSILYSIYIHTML